MQILFIIRYLVVSMAARVTCSNFARKASSVHSPGVSIVGRLRVAGCKKPLETPFMERALRAMMLAQFLQLQAACQLNKKAARPAAFVGECKILKCVKNVVFVGVAAMPAEKRPPKPTICVVWILAHFTQA